MTSLDQHLAVSTAPNGTNGAALHDNLVNSVVQFDTSVFRSYVLALLPPILDALPEDLESLFDDMFDEHVMQFAAEGGGVIYVVKKKDDLNGAALFSPYCDRPFTPAILRRGSYNNIHL